MVNRSETLDTVFGALADPTRRAILARLAGSERPVSDLAGPFNMSLPGFLKHLAVLEHAGLIARRKDGRVVSCALNAQRLRDAWDWLERYQTFWDERLDALERYLDKEKTWTPQRRKPPSRSSGSSKPRRAPSGARSRTRRR